MGVAEERVAVPPVIERAKSTESSAPEPLLVLNTLSEKVTAMLLLSDAMVTEAIVGAVLSFKFAELLLCVVSEGLPAAS